MLGLCVNLPKVPVVYTEYIGFNIFFTQENNIINIIYQYKMLCVLNTTMSDQPTFIACMSIACAYSSFIASNVFTRW
jgi:hypothetical protein